MRGQQGAVPYIRNIVSVDHSLSSDPEAFGLSPDKRAMAEELGSIFEKKLEELAA